MAETNGRPKAWGYGRASDPRKQLLTQKVQEDEIRQRWAKGDIDAEPGKIFMDELSSKKFHFRDRPGFRRLLDVLQQGDHLIVVDLDRVSRGGLGEAADFMKEMLAKEINVHVTRFGGSQLDLNTVSGKAMAGMVAVFAEMESGKISERTKAAIQWLKENGLPWHGHPELGFRRVYTPRTGKKPKLAWVWDEKEREQIREIWTRARTGNGGGESMQQIFDDFKRRGLRTADGVPWSLWRFYRARDWYAEKLKKGEVV